MGFLGERALTRRRLGGGAHVAGRWVPGDPTDTTFKGAVQPLSGRDREVLPEGIRQAARRKVYCARGTLQTDDPTASPAVEADRVIDGTEVWVVVHVDNAHEVIPHDRAYLVREQEC